MDVKLMFVLVSAVFAVAAAYPNQPSSEFSHETRASVSSMKSCNWDVVHIARIGTHTYYLYGCTSVGGQKCIFLAPPIPKCSSQPGQCYLFFWYSGTFIWSISICKDPFDDEYCYKTGSVPNCIDVELTVDMAEVEGIRICDKDANGVEHCRNLPEVQNDLSALVEGSDCFCAQDSKGNKVCVPDNCDANKPASREQSLPFNDMLY